jgi:hypothetical protein
VVTTMCILILWKIRLVHRIQASSAVVERGIRMRLEAGVARDETPVALFFSFVSVSCQIIGTRNGRRFCLATRLATYID